MKVSMDKKYQTIDGQDARILAVDGKLDKYPVIAEICDGDIFTYTKGGRHSRFIEISGLDLTEKVEPIVRYCHLYEDGSSITNKSMTLWPHQRIDQYIGAIKYTITGKDVQTEFIPQ